MAEPFATLLGTVRDAYGGPLPGVTVTVAATAPGSGERVAVTDAEGRFRLRDLAPGAYSVTAELEGFTPSRQQVEVRLGEPTDLAITLQVARVEG